MDTSEPAHPPDETVHASCVALDGCGVLIRGDAGSGKSTLALVLLDRADLIGLPAAFVGDDRIRLGRVGDDLVARRHPALGDRIEVRGLGLCRTHGRDEAARLRLVVDLVPSLPRLPEAAPEDAVLLGLRLPRLILDAALLRSGLAARLVLDAMSAQADVSFRTHRTILRLPGGPRP